MIHYFSENWGTPLIVASVVAMLASIFGFPLFTPNQTFPISPPILAIIATLLFVIGVILQIASFVFVERNAVQSEKIC